MPISMYDAFETFGKMSHSDTGGHWRDGLLGLRSEGRRAGFAIDARRTKELEKLPAVEFGRHQADFKWRWWLQGFFARGTAGGAA